MPVPPVWHTRPHDEAAASALANELKLSAVTARLLAMRGLTDPEQAARFMNPSLDQLYDPFRLADLEREAACLSATFKDDYPRLQEVRRQIRAIETAIQQETQAQVTRAQRDYQAAMRREALLEGALEKQQQSAQALESSSAGYASLKREVTTDQQLYEALDQKLKEVSITGALNFCWCVAGELRIPSAVSRIAASV